MVVAIQKQALTVSIAQNFDLADLYVLSTYRKVTVHG
jgi:hypothetical protein